jgi:DNA-binding NarL/FixJ family response regulator
MKATTILLADDHSVVRQGLRVLLDAQPDFSVVGEATNGIELVEMVEALHPDVVLADLAMPDLNGIEATHQICRRAPKTRVVILSMHSSASYIIRALRSGALGYVLKDANIQEVIQAVRNAAQGQRYLSAQVSDRLVEILLQGGNLEQSDLERKLTGREREILQLIAEGNTNAQIAEKLVISPRTVETHRSRIMGKLNFDSHTDLVRYAIQQGIIPLED